MCIGSALYFTGNLGVSTYDAVALILSEKKVAKFQYCRIVSDLAMPLRYGKVKAAELIALETKAARI